MILLAKLSLVLWRDMFFLLKFIITVSEGTIWAKLAIFVHFPILTHLKCFIKVKIYLCLILLLIRNLGRSVIAGWCRFLLTDGLLFKFTFSAIINGEFFCPLESNSRNIFYIWVWEEPVSPISIHLLSLRCGQQFSIYKHYVY